ncbi:SCP-like protein [Teladorsagia circumcincta]|uniref:SCP-like protein n=1 Tax=Teladorsagia circumcincta TaxID=45464 RepID=A0A2G9UB71_TELCI|nr:SCP-like protein [Teladorsagia circumcincta]
MVVLQLFNQGAQQVFDKSLAMLMLRLFLVLLLATVASAQDDYYDGGDKGAGQSGSDSNTPTPSIITTTTPPPTTTPPTNAQQEINQICSGNRGMNDRIRIIALQGHNYRRSRLALGRVRKNNGALLQPATNMIKLRYDCRLETSAKEVADKCTTSRSALPPEVKQNIHRIHRSSARFRTDAMIEAVKHWWSQVRLVHGIGMRAIFRAEHQFSTIRYFTLSAKCFRWHGRRPNTLGALYPNHVAATGISYVITESGGMSSTSMYTCQAARVHSVR